MVFLAGNASDSSNCTHPPAPVNISKAILLGVILGGLIIFGVLGNILVILSVACHRHLHSVTHYYIVNLAVADLLLTSTVLPFSAIFEILGYWAFGRVFCNIWAAVDVLCSTASILGLCIISIDRYIGVSYPLRYPTIVTQKRGVMALLCAWALSLVISIGPLFGWRQPAPEDETVCQITEEPGYVLFSALGSFYVPLAIILVMYCRVYVVAKRESRGLKSGLKTDKSDSEQVTLRIHRKNAPVRGSGMSSTKNKTHFSVRLLKFSREKKAAKTLGIVVGCFVLCWLPFFLVMPIGNRREDWKSYERRRRFCELEQPAKSLEELGHLSGSGRQENSSNNQSPSSARILQSATKRHRLHRPLAVLFSPRDTWQRSQLTHLDQMSGVLFPPLRANPRYSR
ncbi:alpha-1A adrenergic receptor isoform X2 [Manis javanica]|uniref:alpha-1A adrenergic receptor isoform X2 n=1 Tax=Manis javanica TaxID=9974 RepID=UPI001879CD6B|nr:alpha-1A adrenergic receptor isoform X2 [Manis javanica]